MEMTKSLCIIFFFSFSLHVDVGSRIGVFTQVGLIRKDQGDLMLMKSIWGSCFLSSFFFSVFSFSSVILLHSAYCLSNSFFAPGS